MKILIIASYTWGERWNNWRQWDVNKQREDATLLLLTEGTHSQDDWRETLEHMGGWQGDELVFATPPNATAAEKAQRVNKNISLIQEELLDDTHKWATLMRHINQLSDTPK